MKLTPIDVLAPLTLVYPFSSQMHPLNFISSNFVHMTWIITWGVWNISMQLIDQWFYMFGMCKKKPISHKMKWNFLKKKVLFSITDNLSFLKVYSMGKTSFQWINQERQCHGSQHEMRRLFDTHCHIWYQNNITIGGRLISFLYQLSTHHWRFLLLDMDEYTKFYVVKFQTRSNMKLIS